MPNIIDVQTNLRKIRKSKGLSLHQVEVLSNGKYKPIPLGSYERGTRAITVSKLIELSEFYEVPITELFGLSNTNSVPATKMALIPFEDLVELFALRDRKE
jgi:transcriptional regulator with XRE-family HTH domain